MLNVGFGNYVAPARVLAIVSPDSAPIKRLILEARQQHHLIDTTHGRRTRAVLILDGSTVVLSALHPETLAARLSQPLKDPHP
ncbi:DUF370 domain-containing protein [Parathermosynechococcus lividus]|jgi:regulator of extracellular matrix RemA (YlzA/DUF370 family)|uniref:Putative regulatory protein BRW62_08885 n=1 Tax=Parathermosynechococcus lividus PCC 6715 TaxID=1917166 RepID=A0A2D2Q341_PARLV|nr:DUF370 domain-containing protein [Thermostichus lividus]ATS18839.1 hypothetical protein BRW62_08885 [Thermostichus lividus PCC 6715]MCH9056102.1 DUF370 domain-containing protein [Synechococcus sp. PCC 6716]